MIRFTRKIAVTVKNLLQGIYWTMVPLIRSKISGSVDFDKHAKQSIVVTILAYERPEYFSRTLESFIRINKDILPDVRIIILNQGADSTVSQVMKQFSDFIYKVLETESNVGCGEGVTILMREALSMDAGYVLHLEDDFESQEALINYIPEIREVLNRQDVGCIRLRSKYDLVKNINMVTGQEIHKSYFSKHVMLSNAHFTFNPIMIRTEVIKRMMPVRDEIDSMRKFQMLNLKVAYLDGDCFKHIGDERVQDWVG